MTRKHFIVIAKALKSSNASPETVSAVAHALAEFNPAFDRTRFIQAATSPEASRVFSRADTDRAEHADAKLSARRCRAACCKTA